MTNPFVEVQRLIPELNDDQLNQLVQLINIAKADRRPAKRETDKTLSRDERFYIDSIKKLFDNHDDLPGSGSVAFSFVSYRSRFPEKARYAVRELNRVVDVLLGEKSSALRISMGAGVLKYTAAMLRARGFPVSARAIFNAAEYYVSNFDREFPGYLGSDAVRFLREFR